jgi:MoaA/NifB/PqqE/SkfB family radical SAM enzyme
MRYLLINGEKKRIPPYPHHKDYIYRTQQFLKKRNNVALLFNIGIRMALRRVWSQWRYDYAIPTTMLIDPTSACNIRCKGCWANDYSKHSELSFEKLDEIMTDAPKLGIGNILMTGGEPLVRKTDILKLCRKHKLPFTLFTNGTLIDEPLAMEMEKLGNLNMLISIEGFREATDFRRGEGIFDKAIAAMDLLKKYNIGFGFSICYHSKNYEEVCSDEFLDFLGEKGCWFGWMFNYLPIGQGADLSLCLNAEQRSYVKQKVEKYIAKHSFTIIDFANNGHLLYGCVGAGNGFIHINANGDLEPCAFFHYSDVNINDMTLKEALNSPFFKRFRKAGPFSDNHHRPCPMIDVPEILKHLSEGTEVHSTHMPHSESMQELATKTKAIADKWKPVADALYSKVSDEQKKRIKAYTRTGRFNH